MPGTINPDPTISPTLLTDRVTGDPYLNGKDPWYFSNINPIRNVIGETFRVPVPTTNTGVGTNGVSYGAIYIRCSFGPVEQQC